jgi:leucyl/phenylalanyl-tRNA--protein transferase
VSNSHIAWLSPGDPVESFPPLESATSEPDGLLAAGGDLTVERLLYAYRSGIFPWYDDGQPLLWWSPDPRCVLCPGDLHVSRRLRRTVRQSGAEVRFNHDFGQVIRACAAPRASQQDTWITVDMIAAFEQLHKEGWAHSIEVWENGELSGGLYGLAIGRVFFGESMFSREPNASKIALLALARYLQDGQFELLDCQVISGHLLSLGATLVPRTEFASGLARLCDPPHRFENWPSAPITALELSQ